MGIAVASVSSVGRDASTTIHSVTLWLSATRVSKYLQTERQAFPLALFRACRPHHVIRRSDKKKG